MADETKHDAWLKRTQVWLGILVGVVTLIVGIHNVGQTVFSKNGPGGVSVVVRSARGQPIAQATIELMDAQNHRISMAQTDAAGRFERKGLAAGSYSVKAARSGFEPEVIAIAVQPGTMADLQLALKPAGSPVQSALEEAGASWIKKLGSAQDASNSQSQAKQ